MTVRLNPYLNFRGRTREAMEHYRSAFGGELTSTTFAEGGMPHDPAEAEQIMHAQLEAPNGIMLMAADVPSSMPMESGSSISVSLSGDDETVLRGYWDALVVGGTVHLPLEKAPWGDTFGMAQDRFGVSWMVNISGPAG